MMGRSNGVVDLFFGALEDADDRLVEFAIGGLSNLLSGGRSVVQLLFSGDVDSKALCILHLLDRDPAAPDNGLIVVSALVCLTCLVRHGVWNPRFKSDLTQKLHKLDRLCDSSPSVLRNHVTILKEILG